MQETYNNKELYEKIDPSHNRALVNSQFRGKFNQSAPQELVDEVNQMMIDFVNASVFENTSKGEETYNPSLPNTRAVNDMLMNIDADMLPF
jgi:tryptophanase